MSRDRNELAADLLEMDPDYLVDVLGIDSEEIITAFPKKVSRYLNAEADDEEPEWDDDDFEEEYEDDYYG